MPAEPRNLRRLFRDAEGQRKRLEDFSTTSSDAYQENLASAILAYEECLVVAGEVSLFSPNESLEDISSGDLEYLLLNFWLAQLTEKITRGERRQNLLAARNRYERFLKLLDSYDMLSKSDAKLLEQYLENPSKFSTASTSDATARRNTKIARYKEEKELKGKIEHLGQDPTALENDDDALRNLRLTQISLHVHETFQNFESTALELQMLAMAPSHPTPNGTQRALDERERSSSANGGDRGGYSDRLDDPSTLRNGWTGPLLSRDGKPLRPFTLTDKRTELRQGVFRPDHNLPTMSIDEYLEEERKRGGIIEGGGEKSGIRPDPEEDDHEKMDAETLKQRAWDDWKDDNPKGAGNTMNKG